jgi:glyceraldehyde-3-phosphate dehydrogenase (NADP+)
MQSYDIYVGGSFMRTETIIKVQNPYNKEFFAQTYLAGKNELEKAMLAALCIEKQMREMPLYQRYEILLSIASMIRENREHLAKLLSMESAKPYMYAIAEINRAAQTFTVAAEESKRLPLEYMNLDWSIDSSNREALVKYFPIGVVAGISPFNFPMNLAVHKIAPAIAAGCPVILKPATSTPLSTLELAKIIDRTPLPKGAFSVLPMDRTVGNLLVTDERIKLLTFTGSSMVGWEMKRQCGKKKIVLELGGNAGTIVTASCDLEHAVKRCLLGAFSFSGQVCIHAQRIYVEQSIADQFISKFIEATKSLKYGNPQDADTQISSMIDEDNALRVEKWVNEAIAGGAKLLCGGKRKDSYYEATALTGTKMEMKVCSNEIFGPVVTIETYNNFKQAVDQVNATNYGLQAGVFTNNIKEMDYAFNNIHVGGVILNDIPTFRVDHMPYGGIKDSGLGREGVKYAIMDMLEPKILVKSKI